MPPSDGMPGALPSMWRAVKRGYRAEPRLLVTSFALSLLATLPDALFPLWLKLLAEGAVSHRREQVAAASIALALSVAGTWCLRIVSSRAQQRFRDRVMVALEAHLARLLATISTIAHYERSEYLDRLSILRNQVFALGLLYWSLFMTCGWLLRVGVTLVLLVSIHPVLALVAVAALPAVASSMWRPGVERAVDERVAPGLRLARHLFDTGTTAAPAKEVRVMRIAERLKRERRDAWQQGYEAVAAVRWTSALCHAAAWALFGAVYVAAVAFVAREVGTTGSVLLVLAAGSRLSSYIGGAVAEIGYLRGNWLHGSRRLAWLEDYAASESRAGGAVVPSRIRAGIRFEHVSFTYPGTATPALDDVNLHLKPGSVVAIVGENGAGKTTLVKLLCGLYRPTGGRILVDDQDVARMAPEAWRARLSGAFQDFFKFEFSAGQSVGLGDLPRLDDEAAVCRAVGRAGADDVIAQLPAGLATQLGTTWTNGADLSFGQWQKLALSRAFMRDDPLLLLLDEPTAALDADAEHALFERYAAAARRDGEALAGRIVVLVSHRFSTVRMADWIVVLDGASALEAGSHDELMARGGRYAELYGIQAAAFS